MRTLAVFTVLVVCPALSFADFSYQETTQITGGAMAGMMKMAGAFSKRAGQPVTSTVLIQGNRMAHLSDLTGSIIDLDAQTITNINFEKKTYSVMTFEQMREMMQRMSEKMNGKNGEANVKFRISSKETGRTENIAGFTAKEIAIHIDADATADNGQQGTMNIASNVWLAPDVPGYGEVRDFQKRLAEKLGFLPGEQMAQMRQAAQGMVEVSKEMSKLDGVPVRTITQIGGSGAGPAGGGSQAQARPDNSSNDSGLGALARGFGGFGRKRKDQSADSGSGAQGSGSSALMETTMNASGFSSAPVDASRFAVPAGFKQVDSGSRMR